METELKTIRTEDETWRVVWRDFDGLRVKHGAFVEWPILRPVTKELVFAAYSFNGEASMDRPNENVPVEVRGAVATILRNRNAWLPEAA